MERNILTLEGDLEQKAAVAAVVALGARLERDAREAELQAIARKAGVSAEAQTSSDGGRNETL